MCFCGWWFVIKGLWVAFFFIRCTQSISNRMLQDRAEVAYWKIQQHNNIHTPTAKTMCSNDLRISYVWLTTHCPIDVFVSLLADYVCTLVPTFEAFQIASSVTKTTYKQHHQQSRLAIKTVSFKFRHFDSYKWARVHCENVDKKKRIHQTASDFHQAKTDFMHTAAR